MGKLLPRISGSRLTPQHFSFHSIAIDENYIIDGTLDETVTIDLVVSHASAGALVGSSRTNPEIRNPTGANLSNPQKKQLKYCGQVHLPTGATLHTVQMLGLKPTPFGTLGTWCYHWAAQGRGAVNTVTQEQIDKAIEIRRTMPSNWEKIVRERRREYFAKGYRDTIFNGSCSITTCTCVRDSTCEASVFQFVQETDAQQCLEACGSLGDPKSSDCYWEMPANEPGRTRQSVSVSTDFFNPGTDVVNPTIRNAARKAVLEKLDAKGLVILDKFYDACPEGKRLYALAAASARTMQFPNEVSLNVLQSGETDRGDRTKTMTDQIEDDHPVSHALAFVAEHYLPGMEVTQGKDVKTGERCKERTVLNQTEVEHHARLRKAGVESSVHQILHTDKEMYSELGKRQDPENLNRQNLEFFVHGRGPLSIWVPLVDEGESLSLVGYLGSHKLALKLWVFMARHYAKMQEAYMRGRKGNEVKKGEFLRVWIGAARLFMRREHPNGLIVAERIQAWRADAVLVHGLFVHGGTDEVGLRMFAGYSYAVRVAPINL
jgi:hypothetical protein